MNPVIIDNLDLLKRLTQNASVESLNHFLSVVINQQRVDLLEYLISLGANPAHKNALDKCIDYGNFEMCKVLIDAGSLNKSNIYRYIMFIHWYTIQGSEYTKDSVRNRILKYIVDNVPPDLRDTPEYYESVCWSLKDAYDTHVARIYLDSEFKRFFRKILKYALCNNDMPTVKFIFRKGYHIHPDEMLGYAAEYGHIPMVKYIHARYHPNLDLGLRKAIINEHLRMVKYIICQLKYEFPHVVKEVNRQTIFQAGVLELSKNNVLIFEFLIKHLSNVYGRSPVNQIVAYNRQAYLNHEVM